MADGSAGRRVKVGPARSSSSLPPEARLGAEQTPRNKARRRPAGGEGRLERREAPRAFVRAACASLAAMGKRRATKETAAPVGAPLPRRFSPRRMEILANPAPAKEQGRWRAPAFLSLPGKGRVDPSAARIGVGSAQKPPPAARVARGFPPPQAGEGKERDRHDPAV